MSAFAGVGSAYADETCAPAASCVELAADADERFATATAVPGGESTTEVMGDATGVPEDDGATESASDTETGAAEPGDAEPGDAEPADAESSSEDEHAGEVQGATVESVMGAEDTGDAELALPATAPAPGEPDPGIAALAVGATPRVAPSDITCFTNPTGTVSCFGSGEANADLRIEAADGTTVCETTAQGDGTWMCVSPGPELPTTVVATDRAGIVSPPVALPTLPSRISCEAAAGGIVTCAGLSAPDATIAVVDRNGAEVCSTTAGGDGSWACTSTRAVTATPLSAMLADAAGGVGSGYHGIPVSPAPAGPAPDPAPAPTPDQEHAPAPVPSQDEPVTPAQDGIGIAAQGAAPVDTTQPATTDVADVADIAAELAETGRSTDITGAAFAGAAIIALGALLCTVRRRAEA
jgi:hypothetical protein